MKFSFILCITLLYLTTVLALPATVSQEDDGSGVLKNHVSGPGASGNSFSQSSTTITTSDGRSIVSNHTITSTSGVDACHQKLDVRILYASSLISLFSFANSL